MESTTFVERLLEFGLTRQEAAIYQCLLGEGKTTGYEVAKLIGISRSNAYNSLASLTEKGGAYLVEEGTTRKYVPVPLREFCKNHIRMLEESRNWLISHLPNEKSSAEGYITIEGARHILDKMKNLLGQAENRVYISCTRNYLLLFVRELEDLVSARKKVVIITDRPVHLANVKVYMGEDRGMQIGLITDSKYVLTGEYGEGSLNTCLYSGQKNFVELYKRALGNEIKLLALREENKES
ncbi:TrmB family transcriptional regulator [Extibacter muris]|uniref:TrmB family transcriptional regulator n=1 Tax=Extibacter muris TaxID=1796622 RepID=UPI001D07E27B|nr:TrmB family transcriptional regulator [Extibacter muris]MCB6200285.1 TrmB family transcriptional regulator [Extibacter muris]MCQ4663137.1 TrmB family transcriptional regulator [Extibacter muris]MCQ4692194.1 TrmB family transcriptional regulator [Extibacter muris]